MKRWTCLLAASCILSAALAASGAPYAGADLYTLSSPITNPGGGYIFILGGGGYFAAGGQVVTTAIGPASATLYSPPAGSAVDLTPTSPENIGAYIMSTNSAYQVGDAGYQAMLWHGTADSAIDLGVAGAAVGISPDGGQQVGFSNAYSALLWNGTAASLVSLHPTNLTGFSASQAVATNGVKQVGAGTYNFSQSHALMWTGTADSTVDLDPTNLPDLAGSAAMGISGNGAQQVGYGITLTQFVHALLWNGSADSAIDLHPAGMANSFALATNEAIQVGYGIDLNAATSDDYHALLWTGSAASVFDLNTLLPFAATASFADSIDANGNIFGTATDADGNVHAVEWTPIPEPATLALTALGALALLGRHRRIRGRANA